MDVLVSEVEAVLSGTYLEVLLAEGRPVPAWAWANALAHATEDVLARLPTPPGGDRTRQAWGEARSHLAGEVVATGRRCGSLARLQREVLVPMELALMSRSERERLTPTTWTDEVTLALASHRRERSSD